jgi:hypothetical protein
MRLLRDTEPSECREFCARDPRCRAYSFVRAGESRGEYAVCWLKDGAPPSRRDRCCVSGIKRNP